MELTEEGIALAEMALETNDLWDENDPWARSVLISYCCHLCYFFNFNMVSVKSVPFLFVSYSRPALQPPHVLLFLISLLCFEEGDLKQLLF